MRLKGLLLIQAGKLQVASIKEALSEAAPYIESMRELILGKPQRDLGDLGPFLDYHFYDESELKRGQDLLLKGKCAAVIVAGGQGSRLGFSGPKGCFPITRFEKKSLFELFAEKLSSASKRYQQNLELAIMTSPQNHEETIRFFKKHRYFGLKEQLCFFTQKSLPMLTEEGLFFFNEKAELAKGADGNGGSLEAMDEAGILARWEEKGIEYFSFSQIDNALADPFDALLFAFQEKNSLDIAIKCIERKDSDEKVGLLLSLNERLAVLEYSELSKEEKERQAADGGLLHRLANISLFAFSMPFAKLAAKKSKELPLHAAYKKAMVLSEEGPQEQMVWKFERFIFDLLVYSEKLAALVYPRELCFAPLKNKEGKDSPQAVQEAIIARDKEQYRKLSGKDWEKGDLPQSFYYP